MTASVQDTEDIVQETYLKALGLANFKGQSTLKTLLKKLNQWKKEQKKIPGP
jgi:DNA-directed RNA polymerase specialized sigma24 family protein